MSDAASPGPSGPSGPVESTRTTAAEFLCRLLQALGSDRPSPARISLDHPLLGRIQDALGASQWHGRLRWLWRSGGRTVLEVDLTPADPDAARGRCHVCGGRGYVEPAPSDLRSDGARGSTTPGSAPDPETLTDWDPASARRALAEIPDDLDWDAEGADRGADRGEASSSSDYVDGFNAGLAHARVVASHLGGALGELDAIWRASDEDGVEHLVLYRALAPLGELRRRVYRALVEHTDDVRTPEALRALDAERLCGIRGLGNASLFHLGRTGLVEETIARDAIARRGGGKI